MSYILDALRRAEAERQRDQATVPHLHSAPLGDAAPSPPHPGAGRGARWVWGLGLGAAALGLVALGLVAIGAWWAGGRSAPAPLPTSAPAPLAGPAVVAPARPVPAPAVAPAPVAMTAPAPLPGPATLPAPAPVALPAPMPAAAAAASAVAEPLPWRQLPEATRQRIGPLAVSGAMHSPDPASRLLIVNGQVAREGDTLAPGVVLQEIQPRSALLLVQGQRVLLSY